MKNITSIVTVTALFVTMVGSNVGNYIFARGCNYSKRSVYDTMSGENATQWANATLAANLVS